jgi:hypothetical protein
MTREWTCRIVMALLELLLLLLLLLMVVVVVVVMDRNEEERRWQMPILPSLGSAQAS